MKKEVINFAIIYVIALVMTTIMPKVVGEKVITYLGADGVIYGSPISAGDQAVTEVVRFVMTPMQTGCTMILTLTVCVIVSIIARVIMNKVWKATGNTENQGEAEVFDVEVIENGVTGSNPQA